MLRLRGRWWQVDCYDYDYDGGHDFIGSFQTSVEDLMNSAQSGAKVKPYTYKGPFTPSERENEKDKEQAKEITEKISNIKENFRFRSV